MATWSSTGTAVSGGSSSTLTTLRDRIKTALMGASGFGEPLVVGWEQRQVVDDRPG